MEALKNCLDGEKTQKLSCLFGQCCLYSLGHVTFKSITNMQAASFPQGTPWRTPNFSFPWYLISWVEITSSCLFPPLSIIFLLKINFDPSSAHDSTSGSFYSCRFNLDDLHFCVVHRSVWLYVEVQKSFVHVCDKMHWIFAKIYRIILNSDDILPTILMRTLSETHFMAEWKAIPLILLVYRICELSIGSIFSFQFQNRL